MWTRLGYCAAAVAAVLLFCGADADRSDLNMRQALRGHWATTSGRTHFYYGDNGKLVMVGDGERNEQTYSILEMDEKDDRLRVQILPAGQKEGGHQKTLRFAADRRGILATIDNNGISVNFVWLYIDDKTDPGVKDPLKN